MKKGSCRSDHIIQMLGGTVSSVALLVALFACQGDRPGKPSGTTKTAASSAYDATVAGSKCGQMDVGQKAAQLNCDYTVGKGLAFSIAGVGQDDAGITVTRAEGYSSDYYFTFGLGHGCVIVKPGEAAQGSSFEMAFVSPKNGRVYHTWRECAAVK